MSNLLETQLYRATALTFEELGFLLPSSQLEERQRTARPEAAVEIGFRGPFTGRLVLAVSGGILPAILANMLGEEEASALGAQYDALGELANVICGNVLPGIAGDRHTFNLTPPKLCDLTQTAAGGNSTIEVHVGIEDGRADVYLFLEGVKPSRSKQEAA